MRRIRESRIGSTSLIAETLTRLNAAPSVFVCASAIGYYGDRGEVVLTESSAPGEGFLADVVVEWEGAARPAAEAGVRVVNTRFGVVMDPSDAGLRKMLPFFRLGLGGRLGDGRQYLSWVTLRDVARAASFAIGNTDLSGPVNVVAPEAVMNAEFTRTLASVLHRPALFPVPKAALMAVFGRMAKETLLASTHAVPEKLTLAGFSFSDPLLRPALERLLRSPA